ncbi:MAG: FAD binding domain-containing protein [Bacillota bacterium]
MLASTRYLRPHSLVEALEALQAAEGQARPLAGGTDLLVAMKDGQIRADLLVDLWWLRPPLAFIERTESAIRIGALTTMSELVGSSLIRSSVPVISEAAAQVGAWQTRNLATIGGNLAAAVPSCDLGPPVLVMDAKIICQSARGHREIPVESFFVGPKRCALTSDELLTAIEVPVEASQNWGTCFLKLGRRKAVSLALVNVAVKVVLWEDQKTVSKVRIAAGAVAPTPIRCRAAEQVIQNEGINERTLKAAAKVVMNEIAPISDLRASAEYRRQVTGVLVERAISIAYQRAQANRTGHGRGA